jgi:hypothetical protein
MPQPTSQFVVGMPHMLEQAARLPIKKAHLHRNLQIGNLGAKLR